MPRWVERGEERFWSKVNKSGPVHPALGTPCWEWTASRFKTGYGQYMLDDKPQRAHRVAWTLSVGPIPEGLLVLHKCDNRGCVRVDADPALSHLFLGDHQANAADMVSKGRESRLGCGASQPRGEAASNVILTEAHVREIRAAYVPWKTTQRELARRYGVSQSAISGVLNGYSWNHVK